MYDYLTKTLTNDQKKAFYEVIEWAEKCRKSNLVDRWFVISGYAGTGKSFLTQKLIPALKSIFGSNCAGCAPTHKAVEVLRSFAGNHLSDINTIHKLCHLGVSDPDEKGIKHICQIASKYPYYANFDFVIVDEVSMIGEEIINFIPKKTPTIFLGDIAQLPPVQSDDEKSNINEISPLLKRPNIVLTEVIRYDGEIANYVNGLRENLTNKNISPLISKGNLVKYLDREKWLDKAFQIFKKSKNIDEIKLLAWSNKEVESLNKYIRNKLFPSSNQYLYIANELVIAKEPITRWNPSNNTLTILLGTCGQATIINANLQPNKKIKIHNGGNDLICNIWELELQNEEGCRFDYLAIDTDSFKTVNKALNEFKASITALPNITKADKAIRRDLWIEYYRFCENYGIVPKGKNIIHRLQYAYALTVHQSQGSTFKQVFINGVNMFGCQEIELRNKLFYTGFTRAKSKLHVLMKF